MCLHKYSLQENPPFYCEKLNFKRRRDRKCWDVQRCSSEDGFFSYVLELRGVCGVFGDAGSGLRGFDRLSCDEGPWNRERVRRRSPSCKLLGLCCLSEEFWGKKHQSK